MGIPETQLDTWSHQGSVTGSSTTYNAIKDVLKATDAPYYGKEIDVFLQGSYGNYTNIYAESDVDIVIQLKSTFWQDLSGLPSNQVAVFNESFSSATYGYFDFKKDVLAHLTAKFGKGVKAGSKAIEIPSTSTRRKADVIVAMEYRKYSLFWSMSNQSYVEGIKFFTSTGQEIINYPKAHSRNLTAKHQDTGKWLKPVIRIFKNLRSKLQWDGKLSAGDAPSYYVEGLLYNVPSDKFKVNYHDCVLNALSWIHGADRQALLCANEQYYLLRSGFPTCWEPAKFEKFLAEAIKLWNEW